jgi:hypothetical protein
MFSVNKFIVEPFAGERAIRGNSSSGMLFIEQKTSLKSLKTLSDTYLTTGSFVRMVPSGSLIFVKEEQFHAPGWGQKIFDAEGVKEKFMIVDISFVEFIKSSGEH